MIATMQDDDTKRDLRWAYREVPDPFPMQCGWCEDEIEDEDGGEWVTRYQTTLCTHCLGNLRGRD